MDKNDDCQTFVLSSLKHIFWHQESTVINLESNSCPSMHGLEDWTEKYKYVGKWWGLIREVALNNCVKGFGLNQNF